MWRKPGNNFGGEEHTEGLQVTWEPNLEEPRFINAIFVVFEQQDANRLLSPIPPAKVKAKANSGGGRETEERRSSRLQAGDSEWIWVVWGMWLRSPPLP